jgi:streptogramin lyase
VVFQEYDVPLDSALDPANKYVLNNGSDWSLGTPSSLDGGKNVHDAWADLDGNLWFTNASPSPDITIGKLDPKTGAVKYFKVDGLNGLAAGAHGMTRDAQGNLWFNVGPTTIPNHGGLARLNSRTEKIDVFVPPAGMSGTGGAVTVDVDGKGKIWASAPDGILRFDPDTQLFTEFKSPNFKTTHGTGITYGVAADRDGNGWWAQMALDIVDKADAQSSKSTAIELPPITAEMARITPEEKQLYDSFAGLDFNTPFPWSQGPRRMGADKNGDTVWVCDFWGGSLARIDTHTLQTTIVPIPGSETQYPYHAVVDKNHNVWVNMMNSDQVLKYDPASGEWTFFDLPTRGAETRYISLLERDGELQVVLPYFRPMRIAVMSLRSDKDLGVARDRVQRQ